MSFGWSIGDIFLAIEVIYEVSEALNSSHGSPQDRNDANKFLSAFNHTINVVQTIYGPNLPQTPGGKAQNEDSNVPPPTPQELDSLNTLKELFDSFKEEIKKYDGMNKLPDEKERFFIRRQAQKIQWHFFAKKTIKDLREKISAQLQILQPSLTAHQFQGVAIQSQLYHEEALENFDDVKTMIRVIYSHITAKAPAALMPEPTDSTTLSRASTLVAGAPDDYTGYTTARQQLAPFVPAALPDTISTPLKRLRVTNKLRVTVKTWLTNIDSGSSKSNILWLLENPVSTQCSAILYSVVAALDRPILSFSCSHVDIKANTDIAPETLLRNMVYSFLHTLLTYLDTHLPDVRQRIDASSFSSLDGSTSSIPTALTLLGNLLDNLPTSCVVIIDNAQFLDKDALKPDLLELFALFGRRPNRAFASFEGAHKLLLTTRGLAGVLAEMGMGTEGRLTRLKTGAEVLESGGYILWEELRMGVEGMKVKSEGKEMKIEKEA